MQGAIARLDKDPGYVRLGTEYPHKARQNMVRRLLFLPLVVDVTGPAQANYSLPGLFMTYPRAAKEHSYSQGLPIPI